MAKRKTGKGELTASERRKFSRMKEPVKPKMPHGGARPGSGRKAVFTNKEEQPRSILLTADAAEKLTDAVERTGMSRNDVVCALLLKHADALSLGSAERLAAAVA
jgi:hypothetical protein